ncbi:MAG: hypothetical protein WDO13_07410 [Verrucomicrobiota bacterium]
MTTHRPPPDAALLRAARALRFALIVQGLVRWGALTAGALLVALALDNVLHLPQALRLPLAVVLAGWALVELYRRVLVLAVRKFSPAYAARWLEMHRGIGGNVLINAFQFERDGARPGSARFVAPVVDSSRSILGGIAPRSLWLTPRLTRWLGGLVLVAVAWVVMAWVFPRYLVTGMERLFLPLADVPPVGSWTLEVAPAADVTLVEGDKLDISVRVKSALGFAARPPVPELVWQDGADAGEGTSRSERAAMLPTAQPDAFAFSFSAVHQPFTFHVVADDSRSASVSVSVLPLPQVKGSTFHVTPPAYTGLKAYDQPGPPASLEVPAGSMVRATVELSAGASQVLWRAGTAAKDPTGAMTAAGAGWQMDRLVNESGAYQVLAALPAGGDPRVLAQGDISATPDHPPEVDFVTQDRNRAVNPGDTLAVTIKATDDYGVATVAVQLAASDDPSSARVLKTWSYLGPPGQKEPAPENYTVALDPAIFTPGSTFLLTAQATDFSPTGQRATSRPIVLRVAGLQDMAVPQGDALEKLFDLLRTTIVQQTQANGQTETLQVHVAEAIAANDVARHLDVMAPAQAKAQDAGGAALEEAGKHEEGKAYLARLQPLVHGEMDLAAGQIAHLRGADEQALTPGVAALQKRQDYILNSLIALLGQMASERQAAAEALARKAHDAPPAVTAEQELAKLKDDLKAFTDQQKRIIAASKQIQQLNPEDLTTDQQAVLGELAREEAKAAAYFQEKLTDLSKLPVQDFSDGKIVSDMNEVYQEVQQASTALYQKRVEIAVPQEQAGLELASQIQENLERWLNNTPDNTKWSMEEPAQQQDAPMAELPQQLDDLVGNLLHKEQEMDPDKDDPSSTFMDSLDKGAGWGTGDGPVSNMSAKGVTGNQLPNNNEIGGRSGEGRNGKSDGQMVGNTAVGKGGNETPTRMTPTPFENGSVNDTSSDTKGGATGGGKLAGAGQEGLRSDAPTPDVRTGRLASQQAQLRQQAESLALQLRRQRRPTGDLESAIAGMRELENAARGQNGLGIVQGYHQAMDALQAARAAYAGDRLSRVEADALTRGANPDVTDTQAEAAPAGYEEMTGAYFRSLSESNSTTPPATK